MMNHQQYGLGFSEPIYGVILGAKGGVGEALAHHILATHPENQLILTSRQTYSARPGVTGREHWEVLNITDEEAWSSFAQIVQERLNSINLVINATGLLSSDHIMPERALKDLDIETMTQAFSVNTFGVGLALKYLTPFFPRGQRSVFASCSARVGSISDNRLGGWYSYRASKAAQNMLIKTAAIELYRSRKLSLCVGLHPGTVDSALSAPFTSRVKHRVFTPQESARYLADVLSQLTPENTGNLYAWDGSIIPF